MFNHAPENYKQSLKFSHAGENYKCPICLGVQGVESSDTMLRQEDLLFTNDLVSVFINSFFIEGNEGHVIVVPNTHIENIYDADPENLHAIIDAAQKMALVIKKSYNCDGISLIQNNEPAGGQHAFHFHLHVFPRYVGDKFHEGMNHKKATTPEERLPYIKKLKASLK